MSGAVTKQTYKLVQHILEQLASSFMEIMGLENLLYNNQNKGW